jgi:hypothetical protein
VGAEVGRDAEREHRERGCQQQSLPQHGAGGVEEGEPPGHDETHHHDLGQRADAGAQPACGGEQQEGQADARVGHHERDVEADRDAVDHRGEAVRPEVGGQQHRHADTEDDAADEQEAPATNQGAGHLRSIAGGPAQTRIRPQSAIVARGSTR